MAELIVRGVSVERAEGDPALRDVELTVEDGSTLCVLGRSGSGKSTLLRVIAGLTAPTAGRVLLGGRDITDLPTRDRHVGLVARHDTLPSRQSARRAIAMPLWFRERVVDDRRVEEEAARHGVADVLDARPHQLSGGERLLVQSARAMVDPPSVLLVDEPFADLDHLRRDLLRRRLRERWRDVTVVLATSDAADGVMVADEVAVMSGGTIRQLGPPAEIRARPADLEVASLLGEPEFVVVPATVAEEAGGRLVLVTDQARTPVWSEALRERVGLPVAVGAWPEAVRVPARPGDLVVEGEVDLVEPLGPMSVAHLHLSTRAMVRVPVRGVVPRRGEHLRVGLDGLALHVFDAVDGTALAHPWAGAGDSS